MARGLALSRPIGPFGDLASVGYSAKGRFPHRVLRLLIAFC
jgi:hypothetical protein